MELNSKFIDIEGLGIGEKSSDKLLKIGLTTPYDLFFYFPRRYENYTVVTPIAELGREIPTNEFFTIRGTLLGINNKKTRRRGFTVTEAVVADESDTIKVVWFNQPFLVKMLQVGRELILHGKISYDRFSKTLVLESPTRASRLEIIPVYSTISGLSSFFIAKLFSKLKQHLDELEEWLPQEVVEKYKLMPIKEALRAIHMPKSGMELERAQRRLAFDELFLIALQGVISRHKHALLTAPVVAIDLELLKEFIGQLPFTMTDDQKKASWQIMKDIETSKPMHRLLNGDVGSGKTIVAATASYLCVKSGFNVMIMVPTEILASQHYETFCKLFSQYSIPISLVTSGRKEYFQKPNSKNKIPKASIIIGTQALIQEGFNIDNVGLVIVDEQHRFGVKQRELLRKKTETIGLAPHFLSMTATPIPRTLHLALFGDLDISLIKQKPASRKTIQTRHVESANRDKAYTFIGQQLRKGRQVFVICPLIEESNHGCVIPAPYQVRGKAPAGIQESINLDSSSQATGWNDSYSLFEQDRKSVKAECEKLKKVFSEFRIEMLHGKMKAEEKDAIMKEFASNQINILVSTSVVEVGVDIPNATVMLIEDAERFGLAQTHQFRGRVGRGEHQSYCFLFSNSTSDKSLQRLRLLEQTDDGFALAEADLKMRGPGAIFGIDQSGLIDLKMASFSDHKLIASAIEAAQEIAPRIDKFPELQKYINNVSVVRHME